jgi:uncharacterized protein (UPF0276 family)
VEVDAVAATEVAAEASTRGSRPLAGLGIGWRPPLANWIAARDDLDFLEVVAESVPVSGPLPAGLASTALPVVAHGVGLSLGGAEDLDPERIARLAAVADRLGSPLVSEHIAFVRAGGVTAGHQLPLPRTTESLDVLVAHVRQTQAELPVPLALEHISALLAWPENAMSEVEFLLRLLDRTEALLLLDLANLAADAVNFGVDPLAFLDALPLERIAYCHVAGGIERGGRWHDTHAHPVPAQVLDLIDELRRRRPQLPGILLERDDGWPTGHELDAELDRLSARVRSREPVPVSPP